MSLNEEKTMKRTTKTSIILLTSLLGLTLVAAQVTPPALLNYQGVLRDDQDVPLEGSYDMTFEFYDGDGDVDFKDLAMLLDEWLKERLFP